jgi:DNA mismatch endonuclease (patch repair protein)
MSAPEPIQVEQPISAGQDVDDYPWPSRPAMTAIMRGNRGADTRPEVKLRSELHRRGLRFRKHVSIVTPGLRVRPDVVFTRQRLVVFVDGCFWHGCPEHGSKPRSNVTYWEAKLARNRARDQRVADGLRTDGWRVIRVWEHEAVGPAATSIASALNEIRI